MNAVMWVEDVDQNPEKLNDRWQSILDTSQLGQRNDGKSNDIRPDFCILESSGGLCAMGVTGRLGVAPTPDNWSVGGRIWSVPEGGALDSFFSSVSGSRSRSFEKTVLTSWCIVSSAERRRASVDL